MKKYFYILFIFFQGTLFAQDFNYNINLEVQGFYGTNDASPFWFYSNKNGILDAETNFLGIANIEASYSKNKNLNFEAGVNYYYSDGIEKSVKRNELFIKYYNKYLQAIIGAKNPEVKLNGLSSSNQNFTYSGNARALPGILIEANEFFPIFKFLFVDWGIAHYELNDNRFVDGTMVHYKRIGFNWIINKNNSVYARFQHYAQWGGNNPITGQQPDSFKDFIKVFFGRSGGENAGSGDQQNVLGNHLGSYFLEYKLKTKIAKFSFYWEHPFEDGSGTSFKNFPDGIWGVFASLENSSFFKSLLYEYVDTTNQSGKGGVSGNDNYFNNRGYKSGWTYDGRTIGIPFILVPVNTRTRVHQIGFTSVYKKIDFTFKTSIVQNLGTHPFPFEPQENAVYTYLKSAYSFNKYGDLSLELGYDTSNINKDHFGASLAYSYYF